VPSVISRFTQEKAITKKCKTAVGVHVRPVVLFLNVHRLGAAIFEAGYSVVKVEDNTTAILRSLVPTSKASFEQLFKEHFKGLYSYAYTIIKDEVMAEEIVQQVFCKIWEKKEQLDIHTSARAYLYKAVYHDSLNYLKHRKVMSAYALHTIRQSDKEVENASGKVLAAELNERIRTALNELPEQCRTIFQMSRFEGLKYQEIADELKLSVKTIENQMGKALKLMRLKLAEFLSLLISILLNI
jgi:RNA polymerase sigma-70 factor (ECF subfamily)